MKEREGKHSRKRDGVNQFMIISLVNKIALHIVVGEFLSVNPTCLTPHRAASEKETVALYTAVLS